MNLFCRSTSRNGRGGLAVVGAELEHFELLLNGHLAHFHPTNAKRTNV